MGRGVENALKKVTADRAFFLSNLQDQIPGTAGEAVAAPHSRKPAPPPGDAGEAGRTAAPGYRHANLRRRQSGPSNSQGCGPVPRPVACAAPRRALDTREGADAQAWSPRPG